MLECLHWKGRLIAKLDRPSPNISINSEKRSIPPKQTLSAYFGDNERVDTPVFEGSIMTAGTTLEGPAIIEEPTTTLVVYPNMSVTVSSTGNYILETSGKNQNKSRTQKSCTASVDMAIMSNRIDAILREMQSVVMRTARSAVIGQSRDFSCSIVTANNELLATAEGIPAHIFGSHLQTAAIKRDHPDFQEGDAFLHNDPYDGNSHAADWSIMVPVFIEGTHFFTVTVKGHQADCGDSIPTTYTPKARDVYEEGALIFPCVRIQRNNRDNQDIIRMCEKRIRVPDQWYGDYLAAIGSARIGERGCKAFAEKYGVEKHNKWHFTTGPRKHIYELARMHYFAAQDTGDGGPNDFLHTENLVLVDKEKRLRGFYDGTNYDQIDQLKEDIAQLKEEYE